jgi:soluble lytic murein transglycosylase-like protein
LGVVQFQRGDPAASEVALARAARLAPRDPVVLLWWGYALAWSGRPVEAVGVLRHVALVPASPRARELASQAMRAFGPVPSEQAAPAPPPAGTRPASPSWVLSQESYRAFARFYNPRLSAPETDRIAQALLGYAYHFNLDPRLVVALVVVESGFQPRAVSRAGAIGLGQLMPATARALGVDPWDPAQNLYGSIRYLRGNIDRFGWENTHLALAAYNAGRGAVERHEGIPPYAETRWYVANVSSLYRRLLSVSGDAAQARGGI